MKRMGDVTHAGFVIPSDDEEEETNDPFAIRNFEVPEGIEVFEINGPFFFGAANKFQDAMMVMEDPPRVFILRLRNVPAIDATGLNALESILKRTEKAGTSLIVSGIREQPRKALEKSGLLKQLGENHLCKNVKEALDRARVILEIGESDGS